MDLDRNKTKFFLLILALIVASLIRKNLATQI